MRLSRLRILLLSLLLATISLWITNQQSQSTVSDTNQQKTELGYSWQASQTIVWNISPNEPDKQSVLQAKTILYKESEQRSEYQQPYIELTDLQSTTTLTSDYGESLDDKVFHFTNHVVMTQKENLQPTQAVQQTTLKTQQLTYNLQTNELSTDAKVVITQYNGQTSGTGLKANLKTSELELLSDVKGTYYPQQMQNTVQVKEP
ncbi:LPS export ABC transporter periplasmic protein LptC [Thiomicrorhabdus sp. Kp2]|uniref:LPS export ABC transporter periplasmic protein LptC n=1 Tax=Thiomicrorhabdus sp. Kp2 TaxID=1123518 RepID=UPI000404A835|nr:LPS export ABC transporter periplasmic protein LptC [Thiomicrorhabdus sp. Kp2]